MLISPTTTETILLRAADKSLDVHTWIYFKNAPWDGISRLVGIKGQMASEQ